MAPGETPKAPMAWWKKVLLATPLVLLFLPYPYEVSGSFSIYRCANRCCRPIRPA